MNPVGKGQPLSTVVVAGRDAATTSSEDPEVGGRSREGEGVSVQDVSLRGKGSGGCVRALRVSRRYGGLSNSSEGYDLRWATTTTTTTTATTIHAATLLLLLQCQMQTATWRVEGDGLLTPA